MAALSLKAVRATSGTEANRRVPERGSDPPLLKAAVDHQTCEEEADENRPAEIELGLEILGGGVEGEEEQEPADHQDGVVCVEHGPGHGVEGGPR